MNNTSILKMWFNTRLDKPSVFVRDYIEHTFTYDRVTTNGDMYVIEDVTIEEFIGLLSSSTDVKVAYINLPRRTGLEAWLYKQPKLGSILMTEFEDFIQINCHNKADYLRAILAADTEYELNSEITKEFPLYNWRVL